MRRRAAVTRVAKGRKHASVRRAFGINDQVNPKLPRKIAAALQALLAGRAAQLGTVYAKLISDADAKQARAHLASLRALTQGNKAAKTSEARRAKELAVLQAGLELFYDRYSAACELVFEDDEVQRVEALQLVPRREERRAPAKKEEPGDAGGQGASDASGSGSVKDAGTGDGAKQVAV